MIKLIAISLASIIVSLLLRPAIGDCGLPAIPVNAKISDISVWYAEGTKIEYYCELPELVLLGGKARQCRNNQWIGSIPRCAEEIGFGSIERIEINDSSGRAANITKRIRSADGRALAGEPANNECFSMTNAAQSPLMVIVHFVRSFSHVSSLELGLYTSGQLINSTSPVLDIIVNPLRSCAVTLLEPAVAPKFLLRLAAECPMETINDDEAYLNYYQKDQTRNLTIKLSSASMAVCELRLYYRKQHNFHQCGSADFPLYSSVDFVRQGSKFGILPYFRYSCDPRFELVGNGEVRCGANNEWLDPFPECAPKIRCPMPPERTAESVLNVQLNFEDVLSWNDSLVAIPGSRVIYSCDSNSTRTVMIGDSVRVCGDGAKWTGVEPYCFELDDLKADKYSEVIDEKMSDEYRLPDTPVNDSMDCGLPGVPVFGKPSPGRLGSSGDFRSSYPNGTRISYSCESSYHFMFSNFDYRVCVDGKWTGPIGQCELNYAGKVNLQAIDVYDHKTSTHLNEWSVPKPNRTAKKEDTEIGSSTAFDGWSRKTCAPMNVTGVQRWLFRLNDSAPLSGFSVQFRPGGIYGSYNARRSTVARNLTVRPFVAKLGAKICPIDFMYDYPKYHTMIKFRCDRRPAIDYMSIGGQNNDLALVVDPKQFAGSFDATNFSLCALSLYHAPNACGTPDKPLHSVVTVSDQQVVKYACEESYRLIGAETVSCLRNGRWSQPFPNCKLRRKLCPKFDQKLSATLLWTYENTLNGRLDNQTVVINSIAVFRCANRTEFAGRPLLIGSRTRLCTGSGVWSGSEPFCVDSALYANGQSADDRRYSSAITALVVVVVTAVVLAFVSAVVLLVRRAAIRLPAGISLRFGTKSSSSTASMNQPVVTRPESTVSIADINATIERLSGYNAATRTEDRTQ